MVIENSTCRLHYRTTSYYYAHVDRTVPLHTYVSTLKQIFSSNSHDIRIIIVTMQLFWHNLEHDYVYHMHVALNFDGMKF